MAAKLILIEGKTVTLAALAAHPRDLLRRRAGWTVAALNASISQGRSVSGWPK